MLSRTTLNIHASQAVMSNQIEIARCADTVYARITGLGNFNNAGSFRTFVETQIQDGCRNIVLDLGPCAGLDSTFMGTLMGFLTCPLTRGDCPEQKAASSAVHITVVNPTAPSKRALQSLGLHNLVDLRDTPVAVPSVRLERLGDEGVSQSMRIRVIREAHENLVKLDKANEAKFKPFLDMLLKNSGAQ